MIIRRFVFIWTFLYSATAATLSLQDFGAIPNNQDPNILDRNTEVFSLAFESVSDNVLHVPKNETYYLRHGVTARHVHDFKFELNGALEFVRDPHEGYREHMDEWNFNYKPCLYFEHGHNITFTGNGLINGGGPHWWGIPGLGYLIQREHRPILLAMNHTSTVVIEKLLFWNAPFYTMKLEDVNDLVIRYISVVARRTVREGHSVLDLTAFNTDGIDIAGHNVHVHDVDIYNQDDCIAVKDNYAGDGVSSNMTFERITASGLGLVIGSIGGNSTVRDIVFKDSILYQTFKGIYLKFRHPNSWERGGLIENILYNNITVESPKQWGLWIGPAQQMGGTSRNPCHASPCSLCWPLLPFAECKSVQGSHYRNITLQNVQINNPLKSPGVILGQDMEGLVMDNVTVTQHAPVQVSFPGLERVQPTHRVDPVVRQSAAEVVLTGVTLVVLLVCGVKIKQDQLTKATNSMVAVLLIVSWALVSSLQVAFLVGLASLTCLTLARLIFPLASACNKYRCSLWCWRTSQFVTLFAIAIGYSWSMYINRQVSNKNAYFVCEGVSLGVAMGNTWPVPSCLDDQTLPQKSRWVLEQEHHWMTQLVVLVACVMGLTLCCFCVRFCFVNAKEEDDATVEYATIPLKEIDDVSLSDDHSVATPDSLLEGEDDFGESVHDP